ncbi:unnamed protein product [Mytilus coruscus]|uniref:Uncharacterized protein n=1 Tax=Mytilus coruscus TaxID=42192 RepID=A0A6J8B7R9_MYTCO|nr:unnamed protein product [Mytilus coruscus]
MPRNPKLKGINRHQRDVLVFVPYIKDFVKSLKSSVIAVKRTDLKDIYLGYVNVRTEAVDLHRQASSENEDREKEYTEKNLPPVAVFDPVKTLVLDANRNKLGDLFKEEENLARYFNHSKQFPNCKLISVVHDKGQSYKKLFLVSKVDIPKGQGFDLTPFLESDDNDGTDSDSGKIENDEFSNGQVFDLTPFLESDDNIDNDDNDDNDDTDSAMIENGGLSNVFDLTPFLESDDNIDNDDNDDTDSAMIENGGLSNDEPIIDSVAIEEMYAIIKQSHTDVDHGLHAVAFMDNFIDEYRDPSPERDVMLLPDCINIK